MLQLLPCTSGFCNNSGIPELDGGKFLAANDLCVAQENEGVRCNQDLQCASTFCNLNGVRGLDGGLAQPATRACGVLPLRADGEFCERSSQCTQGSTCYASICQAACFAK